MTTEAAPKIRFPIRLKLALLTAVLVIVPLGVVAWLLIDVNATAIETSSRELQIAVLSDLGRTIDQELVHAQDGLDAIGRTLTDADQPKEARVALAITIVESNVGLDHASIYDARGELIDTVRETATPETLTPPNSLSQPLRAAAETTGVGTGEAIAGPDGVRVPLAIPLRANGRTTGYAASLITLAPVQERVRLLADGHYPGVPDALFILDEDLRVLAHTNPDQPLLVAHDATGLLEGLAAGTIPPNFSSSGEFEGPGGVAMVGTINRLPSRPWLVAAQVPRSQAYASLRTMQRIAALTVAIAIAVSLALGLVVATRIVGPLRQLTAFGRDLGARKFDAEVEVGTRDELAVLAHTMSTAARELGESEARIREEEAIRHDLGRYVPAEIVERVVAREQDMNLGGERREISVMFADVVAFTPLTEQLEPEKVVHLLNELFTIATEIVFRHGGTVDKFMGDCVMAIWGAPTRYEDHAYRAVSAAEELLSWLEVGNERWQDAHGVSVQLAIGINTGMAIVGNIGSETRMEYTAIGDAVNVAAHLEGIARPGQILVSDATRRAVGDAFEFVSAGTKTVAGRRSALTLYEVEL